MDIDRLKEIASQIDSKKEEKKEELEGIGKLYERFHLLNRKILDEETYEKTRGSAKAMTESIAGTVQFIEDEIARLRSKRMKTPFENMELTALQKTLSKNEFLLKEYLGSLPRETD